MIEEQVPLKGKTMMRIGGIAQYYAELKTKDDVEAAWAFAMERDVPVVVLGSGTNTVFADGLIRALVIRIAADTVKYLPMEDLKTENCQLQTIEVHAGANLPMLLSECAKKGLDLSPLTGIPGTVGGAIFGNAGQGPGGIWIDRFVRSVTAFVDGGWRTFAREECDFGYRESSFKHGPDAAPVIWEAILDVPQGEPGAIEAEIERLLQKRIATQPHARTAGSIFKAHGTVPAWKLIDTAGLRGLSIGGAAISEQHANFLINKGSATFADAKAVIERVRETVDEPLDVEMRFIEEDGGLSF